MENVKTTAGIGVGRVKTTAQERPVKGSRLSHREVTLFWFHTVQKTCQLTKCWVAVVQVCIIRELADNHTAGSWYGSFGVPLMHRPHPIRLTIIYA